MKKYLLAAVLSVTIMLTGCTSVYNLTSEDSDVIAEYAAGVLSNYSKENKSKTIQLKAYLAQQETQTEAATEAPSQPHSSIEVIDPNGTDNSGTKSSWESLNMASMFGMENVDIECVGYELTDAYPKDEYALSVQATDGHTLVVVEYKITNTASQDIVLNVTDSVSIRALINGSTYVKQYATLLNDDITNMNGKQIAAGETIDGVLIFNVKDSKAENIESLDVVAK